jgi:hypothetical protein
MKISVYEYVFLYYFNDEGFLYAAIIEYVIQYGKFTFINTFIYVGISVHMSAQIYIYVLFYSFMMMMMMMMMMFTYIDFNHNKKLEPYVKYRPSKKGIKRKPQTIQLN